MKSRVIKIGDKNIGDSNLCYTIAEAGANHDSNVEKAFKLIDAAVESKSDSIKFQTYTAKKLVTKNAPKYWEDGIKNETQYDVFKKLDLLSNDNWKSIFEYGKKKEITCFSTPFDEKSADLLYSFDVPAFKIASADITHIPLIKHVARKKLPIFISTGMASENDIDEAINAIEDQGNHEIIIMHCITSYPTKPEDANLEMIKTLQKKFYDYVIGYSDHTIGTTIPICSVFYGAKCIEKHFTFDTSLSQSRDHRLSLDVKGFSEMVNGLRLAEISKGKAIRDEFDVEKEAVKYARRSIVSVLKIPKGTTISKEMLDIKRPGTGIPPKYFEKIIGSSTLKDIEEDVPINFEDISL
jgi:N,N'-diacetyllegionaminate synthase